MIFSEKGEVSPDHRHGVFALFVLFAILLTLAIAPMSTAAASNVTVGNVSSLDGGSGQSFTLSHTVGSGDDQMLLVSVTLTGAGPSAEVASVTYGGESLTEIENFQGSVNRIQQFRLMAPTQGTANVEINIESGESNEAAIGVSTFNNVNQNDPHGTFVTKKKLRLQFDYFRFQRNR